MPLFDRYANPMWRRFIDRVLDASTLVLPPGAHVLEIGSGDGRVTAAVARRTGWRITAIEIDPAAVRASRAFLEQEGLTGQVEIRHIQPEDAWRQGGTYDGVFIKTVLYLAPTLEAYGQQLDALLERIPAGGALVVIETGRGSRLMQAWRRLARRDYADGLLWRPEIERLFSERLQPVTFLHAGRLSPFLIPLHPLDAVAEAVENAVAPPDAASAFMAAAIGLKPGRKSSPREL